MKKTYLESGDISPLIFSLTVRLTELEAGFASEPVWTFWRRNMLPLCGFEPRFAPPVA
jgi:hypothetical protein